MSDTRTDALWCAGEANKARAEVRRLETALATSEAARIAAEAEVGRLREALRFIANAKIDHLSSGQQHLLASLIKPAQSALDKEASL